MASVCMRACVVAKIVLLVYAYLVKSCLGEKCTYFPFTVCDICIQWKKKTLCVLSLHRAFRVLTVHFLQGRIQPLLNPLYNFFDMNTEELKVV